MKLRNFFILSSKCEKEKNEVWRPFRGQKGPLLLFSLIILGGLAGCSTPFWATDNPVFLMLPGTERRSDQVEGVLRPWERLKLIDEKGEKGEHASLEEKNILAYQLIEEYKRSDDPLIRRASIEAIGRITKSADIPPALDLLTEALTDPSLGNRVAACDALGEYGLNVKSQDMLAIRNEIAQTLEECYREQAYSASSGMEKENNDRKDLRLAILRNLTHFEDSEEMMNFFSEALDSESLDDGALHLGVMRAMNKVTKKDYGYDYNLWREYADYRLGKSPNAPKEVSSLANAIKKGDLSILK